MDCCKKNLEFKLINVRKGFTEKESAKCPDCSTVYLKKKYSRLIYKSQNDNDYKCSVCGSDIIGIEINHPLWDPHFICTGGGGVINEFIHYCPKCESKPEQTGSPVYENINDLF